MNPTTRPRPVTRLAAITALLAALVVAGCGSSGTPTAARPSPSSSVSASQASSRAAATPTSTAVATPAPTPVPTPQPTATPTPTAEPSQSPVNLTDATAAALQATTATLQTSKALPGLQVAVDFPDGRVWAGQSGKAVLSTKAQVSAETLFSIGSISKTFLAALVMRLAEEGTLSLDDPLSKYAPSFYLASKITIRMLLNHTSGVMDVFAATGISAAILAAPTKVWTNAEVLSRVGRQRYAFAPGAGYKYSNTDYVLLQVVVEKATGQTVAALVRARFLDPLGLQATFLQTEERAADLGIANPLAHGYLGAALLKPPAAGKAPRDNFRGTMMPFTAETTVVGAAGGYASTASDIAQWASALYGGRVLSPDSLAAMMDTSQTAKFRPKWVYGLGTEKVVIDGHLGFGHRGNLDGFWSAMFYIPDYGVSIAVITNANWGDPLALSNAIAKVILPTPAAPPSTAP